MTRTVLILGAAGRDFHDFNTVFRGDDRYEVAAFVQVGGQNLAELADSPVRRYPPELAGEDYPDGIPIRPASELDDLIAKHGVDEVVLSYSDVSHRDVMHQASRALAAECSFRLIGPEGMMLDAPVPVIGIDAVRTGTGKSQASQKIAGLLDDRGVDVVVIREPMPYGDLAEQRVQRFASMQDLDDADVTIEEREEYERHIAQGHVVYAGVDYADIVAEAAAEADVIIWEGGNNELPFVRPDLHLVMADPHRAGDEVAYHPGEANLRMADVVVINKENTAAAEDIETVVRNTEQANPDATVVHADSVVSVDDPSMIEGKRVLVVEDGPTLTHGGTSYGAGTVAAEEYGAAERLDPRPGAVGSIARILDSYPQLDRVLPAMGYSAEQRAELSATIRNAKPDVVVAGTPIDLDRVVDVDVPVVQVHYRIENEEPSFASLLDRHADQLGL